MAKTYIRWMGAFAGRQIPLEDVLNYELSKSEGEAACEKLINLGNKLVSKISTPVHVGLIVNPKSVFRSFGYDCWSVYTDGRLRASRTRNRAPLKQSKYHHTESWFRYGEKNYIALVISKPWSEISGSTRRALLEASNKFSIEILELRNGKIVKGLH